MSTRCQIEFRSGKLRRTVYRHWDGYPSAVIPDLLAFLAWSTRHGELGIKGAECDVDAHGVGDAAVVAFGCWRREFPVGAGATRPGCFERAGLSTSTSP